nr:MAG TPA: terminase large subunit [Caudoviricetes sp.]
MSDILLSEKIGPAFYGIARDIFRHGHTHYDFSGGRGSLKSSTVSILVPVLLVANPGTHALVLRKVANTIRDSVYAQYIWAIGELGMAAYWEAKVSPMELIYKPTGQKIMFRGADDPMKIKSIKVPFGYIAVTHFEEKDQFAGRAEIRTILQSTMRGGSMFWNFESYNPPISRDNWANKDSLEDRPDRLCHKSTYLEAPPEWLGEQFLAEAEHLKSTDDRAYQHEYLGIPVGTGGNVFENLELREIMDAEVKSFDRIYQGTDWGWFPDPFAFIRLHYNRARETIYLIDEIYQNKITNEASAQMILSRGYNDTYITCDSAEPKSVADFRAMRLKAQEAIKGPGSVEYGMKWLQRRKIVIDRRRTPNAYNEFVNYEYERNKDGDIISGYPDANNHLIDATRYALERVFRRMGVTA